jgi:hypothetical protein
MFHTTKDAMPSSIDKSISNCTRNKPAGYKNINTQSNIRFYIENISISVYDDYKFNLSSNDIDADLKYNKLSINIEDIIISVNLTDLFKSSLSIHSFYVKEHSICNNNEDCISDGEIPWIYTVARHVSYSEQVGRGHTINGMHYDNTININGASNSNATDEESIYCCEMRSILTCYHQTNTKRIITPPQVEGIFFLSNYLSIFVAITLCIYVSS